MRIKRTFGYEGGNSFQDMTMEQTFEWSEEEQRRVPPCIRNAVEAAAVIGNHHFETDKEYGFPLDAKGRPTLLAGAIATVPDASIIIAPLAAFWRDLVASVSKSFDGMKVSPDIDKTHVMRPFLARMMLLDMLLRENPYHEAQKFDGGGTWENSWHRRREWTRRQFLDEVAALRAPT